MYKRIISGAVTLFLIIGGFPGVFVSAQPPPSQIPSPQARLETLTVPPPPPPRQPPLPSPASQAPTLFMKTLARGSRNDEVSRLQVALRQFNDVYHNGAVVGYYGALTETAVKKFQKKYGLPPSGVVGPRTREVLNNLIPRLATPKTSSIPEISSGGGATESAFVSLPTPLVSPSPIWTPEPSPSPYFSYGWRATTTNLLGEVYLPTPAPKPIVILDGKPTTTLNTDAAVRLAQAYNIILVDDEEPWDPSTAGMLYEMVRRLDEIWTQFGIGSKPWKVRLTKELLPNDVDAQSYSSDATVRLVRITKDAFTFSNPSLQPGVDGSPERVFYSNRLFRAVLRSFFNETGILKSILQVRYGLTAALGTPPDEFQEFSTDELQYVLSVLEDLPSGYRKMPGLYKIVRRKQGLTNPQIPAAAAIAFINLGYMEFTDFAFRDMKSLRWKDDESIRLVIAHEITHFLWNKVLTQATKDAFAALSGWSQNYVLGSNLGKLPTPPNHPKANYPGPLGYWYRMTSTNFVSDYAAHANPEEDFCETVAHYIYRPDFVRTIAPDKYEFVKKVTKGYEYVTLIDERFTFQVFDLEPDVTFPGQIIGVNVEAYKLPSGDNRIVATIKLAPIGDGASSAYARLLSPLRNEKSKLTSQYVTFSPLDNDPYTLRSEFIMNQYMLSGYWVPEQIIVQDRVDHKRRESQNQFGWLLYINNPNEDIDPPVADVTGLKGEQRNADGEETVTIRIPAKDNNGHMEGWARLNQYESSQVVSASGAYDPKAQIITFAFLLRRYMARGTWTFREFWLQDPATNEARYDLKDRSATFNVDTPTPDYTKPKLDISSIQIKAVPAHPEAPDGETSVVIKYAARDDIAGLSGVYFVLLKPTGETFGFGHSHPDFTATYFPGNPAAGKSYEASVTLPKGSPPGTWALQQVLLYDKAGNAATFNFAETGILRPFDVR